MLLYQKANGDLEEWLISSKTVNVQKLIPLEIRRTTYLTNPEEDDLDETDDPVTKCTPDCNVPPTRKATQKDKELETKSVDSQYV